MDLVYIRQLVDHLDRSGVIFDSGLSDPEIERVEQLYGFRFPPDLRKLLQRALPVGERFPNWRKAPLSALRDALEWPARGILEEVERRQFWLAAWGDRPQSVVDALATVKARLDAAPAMVPIFAHRYLAATPLTAGNPVFSIVGTDIIYAGSDLASFFAAEFDVPCPAWAATEPRPIPFWDDLVS